MKCQNCGKEIASNNRTCPYCGEKVSAGNAWYKQWWIWVIAVSAIAAIVVTCILTLGSCGKNEGETPVTTTVAPTTVAVSTETTTAPGKTIDQIVADGYEKVSYDKLFSGINTYKNKRILTAAPVKDISSAAIYSALEENGKTTSLYKFNFTDPSELENILRGDYAAIYGTVDKNGSVSGTINVNDCHVALTGGNAKTFFDSLKNIKTTSPTTTPATTVKATTAPTTAKPVTTAPTTAPVTTVPATTVAPTTAPSNVLFNQNGLKVTYLSTDSDDAYVNFTIRVENKTDLDYQVSAENVYVNGTAIDMLGIGEIYSGESADTELYLKKSDLENAGIKSVNELVFNLLFDDEGGSTVPIRSGSVTVKP